MLFTERWRALLACACSMLLAATSAATAHAGFAGESPVGSARVSAALRIADGHWGAAPCKGLATLTWSTQAPNVNAISSWSNMGDPYAAWGGNFDCTIAMNPAARWDWPKFCTVIVHEVGHLEGHPHSADPDDVMAPYYSQPAPDCSATPDPQAPAAVTRSSKPRTAQAAVVARRAARARGRARAVARAHAARHRVARVERA